MPLDIATMKDSGVTTIGEYRHKSVNDYSLFEKYGRAQRVPIEALVPDGDDLSHPERLDGFDALMNPETGELLKMRPISRGYKLEPHDTLFRDNADILNKSGLPLADIDITDRLYDGGLKAHRTVYFNDLQADIGNTGDNVRCRLDIFNSIDQSWAFQVFSGAYRDLCRNTLVFGGQKSYQQKRKHTRNLDTTAMMTKASNGLEIWTGQRDQMRVWTERAITNEQFGAMLANTLCKKTSEAAKAGQGSQVNERLMNYLLHRFNEEKAELGSTLWAGYNALTHWATHIDEEWTNDDGTTYQTGRKGSRRHMVEQQRNKAVRDIMADESWQHLELAAA